MLYPYKVTYDRVIVFFLWEDRDSGGDRFIVSKENGEVIAMRSEEDLRDYASAHSLEIVWSDVSEFDIDQFLHVLSDLKPGHRCEGKVCEILLDGWNLIEDFFRTFDVNLDKLKSDVLRHVYKKLFYGNNLPSVTPEGEHYEPVFDGYEVHQLQTEMKKSISLVGSKIV
jgi:hypothetical protein